MAIYGFVGEPGSAKTCMMVETVRQRVKRDAVHVVTNMSSLRFPGAFYIEPQQLEDFGRLPEVDCGAVMIDEGGVFLNSRFWQEVSRGVLSMFAQSRHFGYDLYFSAQYEEQIDKGLRELCEEVIHCRRIFRDTIMLTHRRLGSKRDVRKRRIRRIGTPTVALYWTRELMGLREDEPLSFCPELAAIRAQRAASRGALLVGAEWYRQRSLKAMCGDLFHKGQGESVGRWLRAHGDGSDSSASFVEAVRAEIERRLWLADFGLSWEHLNRSVTFHAPWCPGGSPAEASERAERGRFERAVKVGLVEREKELLKLASSLSGGNGKTRVVANRRL